MSTLNDVYEAHKFVEFIGQLMGRTADFAQDYQCRLEQVGLTLCADLEIAPGEGLSLSNTTELTPAAEEKFQELKDWLLTQHPEFQRVFK